MTQAIIDVLFEIITGSVRCTPFLNPVHSTTMNAPNTEIATNNTGQTARSLDNRCEDAADISSGKYLKAKGVQVLLRCFFGENM
jgi:hypothetical protein